MKRLFIVLGIIIVLIAMYIAFNINLEYYERVPPFYVPELSGKLL